MAKPRIFISSTFYDLKYIREDLERFIRELGYEPIRYEAGDVPYGKDEPLEAYAYREVELCDIIVSIIGGRFGTESRQERGYSITQAELKRALERGIQVFVFIEKNVHAEYSTYKLNKGNPNVQYRFVDDVRVYEFIESIYALPRNNPITSFETTADIIRYLKAQWAGMFQRFLQEQKRISEIQVLDEMRSITSTLQQLVNFLTDERKSKDEAIQNILLANHPAFRRFAKLTNTRYRVFFSNRDELESWLKARNWTPVPKDSWDQDSVAEWGKDDEYIKMTENIFDDKGSLKIYSENDWNDDWVKMGEPQQTPDEKALADDEIPF